MLMMLKQFSELGVCMHEYVSFSSLDRNFLSHPQYYELLCTYKISL